jgi:uncharacterized protein YndB with AHSA1/START domain
MEIDRDAPAIASGAIVVSAPREVVWEVLTRLEEWPTWNPDVKSMSVDGPVAEGTEFKWKAGPSTITSTIRRVDSPALIGWTGRTLGIDAVHVWRLAPDDGGTRVETEESWAGWLPRLLGGRAQRMLQQSLDEVLPRLKTEAERRAGSPAV